MAGDYPAVTGSDRSVLASDILGRTKRLIADNDGSLQVNLAKDSSGVFRYNVIVNVFNAVACLSGMETNLLTYTVPLTLSFDLSCVIGWGDVDAEYFVKINGVDRGGFRTSPSERTIFLSYGQSPIVVSGGNLVTITAIHFSDHGTQILKANLLGGIRNG